MPVLNPIPTPAYTATSATNADTFNPRAHMYNTPSTASGLGAVPSTIGAQCPSGQAFHLKKALVEAAKARKFGKLADHVTMPKNMGERITMFHYFPMLDDRNTNDQGIDARGVQIRNGNLYGSSKDVGTITGRLPTLTEDGGRRNRVGFQRALIEGTFHKFGFFYEWTEDSVNFDSDPMWLTHVYTEAIKAAEQIQEAQLQNDLLNAAGVILYSGAATNNGTMNHTSVVDYKTLKRLETMLNDNNTPKTTTILSGTRMVDTRTIRSSRVLFVGSEVVPLIESMVDSLNRPAFIPVQMYAADPKAQVMEDEIGSVGTFRIVEHNQMHHWAGQGATEVTSHGLRATGGKYNIYPMLVVTSGSFSTIGFLANANGSSKLRIITKKPGEATADRNDPYGEVGFTSIRWFYGCLIQRSEWIGLIKTVAPL